MTASIMAWPAEACAQVLPYPSTNPSLVGVFSVWVASEPLALVVAQSWAVNSPCSTPVVSSVKSEPGGGASTLSSDGEGLGVLAAAPERGDVASATAATSVSVRIRPFTRHILSINHQPSGHSAPVPMKVTRQPLQELETALARGPVAPRRRHLGDAHPQAVRLDRQLEP